MVINICFTISVTENIIMKNSKKEYIIIYFIITTRSKNSLGKITIHLQLICYSMFAKELMNFSMIKLIM